MGGIQSTISKLCKVMVPVMFMYDCGYGCSWLQVWLVCDVFVVLVLFLFVFAFCVCGLCL